MLMPITCRGMPLPSSSEVSPSLASLDVSPGDIEKCDDSPVENAARTAVFVNVSQWECAGKAYSSDSLNRLPHPQPAELSSTLSHGHPVVACSPGTWLPLVSTPTTLTPFPPPSLLPAPSVSIDTVTAVRQDRMRGGRSRRGRLSQHDRGTACTSITSLTVGTGNNTVFPAAATTTSTAAELGNSNPARSALCLPSNTSLAGTNALMSVDRNLHDCHDRLRLQGNPHYSGLPSPQRTLASSYMKISPPHSPRDDAASVLTYPSTRCPVTSSSLLSPTSAEAAALAVAVAATVSCSATSSSSSSTAAATTSSLPESRAEAAGGGEQSRKTKGRAVITVDSQPTLTASESNRTPVDIKPANSSRSSSLMTSESSLTPRSLLHFSNPPDSLHGSKRPRLSDLCMTIPQGHGILPTGATAPFGLFPSNLPPLRLQEVTGNGSVPPPPNNNNNFLGTIGPTDEYLAYGAHQSTQAFQLVRPTPVMQPWFPYPTGQSDMRAGRRQSIVTADAGMPSSDFSLYTTSPTAHPGQDYSQLNQEHRFLPQMHQDLAYPGVFTATNSHAAQATQGGNAFVPHLRPQHCFNGQPALLQSAPTNFATHPPNHMTHGSPDGAAYCPATQSPTRQHQLAPTNYPPHPSLPANQFAPLQPLMPDSSSDQLYLTGTNPVGNTNTDLAHNTRFNGDKEGSRVVYPASRGPVPTDESLAPSVPRAVYSISESSGGSEEAADLLEDVDTSSDEDDDGDDDTDSPGDEDSDCDLVVDDDEEDGHQPSGGDFRGTTCAAGAPTDSSQGVWEATASLHHLRRQFSMAEVLRLAGEHDHRVTDLLFRFLPQLKSYLTQLVGTEVGRGQDPTPGPPPSVSAQPPNNPMQIPRAVNGDVYSDQYSSSPSTAHNGLAYDVTSGQLGSQPSVNGSEGNTGGASAAYSVVTECLLKSLCCLLENCLFSLVDWVGQTNMFKVIPVDDKMQLLNSSWSEIILLEYIHHYVTSYQSSISSGSPSNSSGTTEEESTMLPVPGERRPAVPPAASGTTHSAGNPAVDSSIPPETRNQPSAPAGNGTVFGGVCGFCELADSLLDHLLLSHRLTSASTPPPSVNAVESTVGTLEGEADSDSNTTRAAIAAAAGVSGANAVDCRRKLDDLIGQFERLQLTSEEFTCLKFLVLFNPTKHDLHITSDAVRHIQWVQSKLYSFLLRGIHRHLAKIPTEANCPTISSADYLFTLIADRFGKILLQLTEIKQLAFHMEGYLLSRYRDAKIPHESLLTEMLLTKRQVMQSSAPTATVVVGSGADDTQVSMQLTDGDSSSSSCTKPEEEEEEERVSADRLSSSTLPTAFAHASGSDASSGFIGQPRVRLPDPHGFGGHGVSAPTSDLLRLPNGSNALGVHSAHSFEPALPSMGSD